MEFDQTKTNQIKQNPKYQKLLKWGLDNGVIIKDVDLPASFGDLIGVVATKDIPSNTAIICVPQTLIISQEKCLQSNLSKMYNENPQLFDENETQDAEFNILIFYLYNEKKKGEQSFYYPYIQAIQTNNTLIDWTKEELQQIEDQIILDEFQIVKQDLQELWSQAKMIFLKYTNIFGESLPTDKQDFYWAAQSVMSRCFGWSLKSTSMIPIADFLNHSNRACTHYLVHENLEKQQPLKQFINTEMEDVQKQYIIKKDKINLQILNVEQDINKIPQYQDKKQKYILENQQYLNEIQQKDIDNLENLQNSEKRALINWINYEQLNQNPNLNVWDLGFITSSDSEDNDSDEEIEQARSKQFEALKVRELKEWKIKQEQKRIENEHKKQQQQQIQNKDESIVTVCLNVEKKNQVVIKGLPQYQVDILKQKKEMINFSEDIEIQQQEQQQQQKEEEEDSESSEESKWDWLEETDDKAYFCITTTEPIKKHEQVCVSYGRRTNRFLLSWYGFALPENKYSSVNFRLWLNTEIAKEKIQNSKQIFDTITINKLIQSEEWDTGKIQYKNFEIPITAITKEFRIKKNKLNMDLLMYLRLYLMLYYTHEKDVLITIPVSLDYEIFVMQFCIQLLQYFLNQFSQDLAQDNKELEQDITFQRRFAIYINKERKEIIINQIMILLDAIIILKKQKEYKDLKPCYMSELVNNVYQKMEILRGLKQYLKSIHDFL